jgi:hypothetical protein
MLARQNKSLEKNYWSPIKFIINLDILPLGVTKGWVTGPTGIYPLKPETSGFTVYPGLWTEIMRIEWYDRFLEARKVP